MRTKSHLLLQIVLKCLMSVSEIPKQIWDENLRFVSSKLTYELLTMGFQLNEQNLNKRIIYSQIKLPLKKFFTISKVIMVPEETVSSKEEKKLSKNAKKPQGNPSNPSKNPEIPKEAEVKMIPKILRNIYDKNSLQGFLEESLANYSEEYGDFLQNFIETWKEQLDGLSGFLEGDLESIEKLKSELSLKVDFWEICKDLTNGLAKLQASYKNSPFYLEFFCKFIRRCIENGGVDIKTILEQCSQIALVNNDVFLCFLSQKDMKLEAIRNDVDWAPETILLLKKEKETNKIGEEKAIEVFEGFFKSEERLKGEKGKEFNYENVWRGEMFFLRATAKYLVRYVKFIDFFHFFEFFSIF